MTGVAHDGRHAFAYFRMRGGALFVPLRLCVEICGVMVTRRRSRQVATLLWYFYITKLRSEKRSKICFRMTNKGLITF